VIELYDRGNTNFTRHGDVMLTPISCTIKNVAGGECSLQMVHPIDQTKKWEHLVPEAIIRAPVPKETISTSYTGMDVDLYQTTTKAALRSGTTEPTTINYSAWSADNTYSVGSKVTYNNKNYQCVKYDEDSDLKNFPPPNCSWWTKIARQTSGSPVLANLKSGTKLYYVRNAGSGWLRMSTTYGLEGYIKSSQVSYVRHITPEENQPVSIETQAFRIKTSTADTKEGTVTVYATHVSYDLAGVMVRDAKISQRSAAMALYQIEEEYMKGYRGTVATDLVNDSDGTYTGEIKGKNAMFALLDPDKGIVAHFGAMLKRNNWDLFVMRKTAVDRGFRLRYGKNIMGVSWEQSSDDLVTQVVPVAKNAAGDDLFLPEWHIDSSLMNSYPEIYMDWLKVPGQVGKDDGTETGTNWTEAALLTEMRKKAQERYSVDKADQIQHEITIDFKMIGDTAEYPELKDLENVVLYDQVIAIDERVGLSATMEVVELEWDAVRECVTGLKLSNVNWYGGRSVSGFNVMNNSLTGDKLTDDAGDGFVTKAVDLARDELEKYTNSKVNSLNNSLRKWVQENYEPKSTE